MTDQTGTELNNIGQAQCLYCGEALTKGASVCPACERQQHRLCQCGLPLQPEVTTCPQCGAERPELVRRKRRSRSSRVKPQQLARSITVGAVGTLLGAILLNLIISALAARSTPDGTIPPGFVQRVGYAGTTLAQAFATLFSRLMGMGLLTALGLAAAGAVGGGLWYLGRVGVLRWARWTQNKEQRSSRRRRRTI